MHIFKSTNGGKTWQESDEGFPHAEHTAIHDIAIDPKNTAVIYVATTEHEAELGKGIFKSTDAGKTWSAANAGLGSMDIATIIIHPTSTNMLIVATHDGVYKSNNAANSWSKTSSSSSFDVEYVKDKPDVVYASTNDGVLKSEDFGETWHVFGSGLPSGDGQGMAVDPTGNVIYAAVKYKGLYVVRLASIEPDDLDSEIGASAFSRFEIPDFGIPDTSKLPFGKDNKSSFPSSGKKEKESGAPGYMTDYISKLTIDDCKDYSFPPACSLIPDEGGRAICEKCKILEQAQAAKPEKKEMEEKENLLRIVMNMLRLLFGWK